VERSKFDHCDSAPIAIFSSSNADIFSCQFLNSNYSGVDVCSGSKLRIHGSVFENCNYGIYSYSKSETQVFNCSFRQMREYSIYCKGSAIINLNGCELVDPKKAFFYSTSEGFIKVFSSRMKQSNKDLPIASIENSLF
jgi:hypothetical protein